MRQALRLVEAWGAGTTNVRHRTNSVSRPLGASPQALLPHLSWQLGQVPLLAPGEGGPASSASKAGDLGLIDCSPRINSSRLWISGCRQNIKVPCCAWIPNPMQRQNPLCYHEVTLLSSVSLMITHCFPGSAPKLLKRRSLSPAH